MTEMQWTMGTSHFELPKYIREKVFMQEQGFDCEFDATDSSALHLSLRADNAPAGCARLYRKEGDLFAIGRVALLPGFRGSGLGRLLMEQSEEKAALMGAARIGLSAQVQASGFYERLGYLPQGEEYLDEHCPHVWMEKALPPQPIEVSWVLPGGDITSALKVRQAVFGDEFGYTGGPDQLDPTSHTLVLTKDGQPVGCGRVTPLADGSFRLGKIALLPALRGQGAGERIMANLEFKALELGATEVFLWAQLVAKGFYLRMGYHSEGEDFLVEGKPHVKMVKTL